jgi:WhiB family transcriptional regulator, redox-sensing transcriptional regulator
MRPSLGPACGRGGDFTHGIARIAHFGLTDADDTRVISLMQFSYNGMKGRIMWNVLDDDLGGFPSDAGRPVEAVAPVLPLFGEVVDDGLMGWQERALCAQTDPEAFFPEKGGSTREAKKVCTGCEVRSECLEYALEHDERFGIWGGLSERERRKLKRRVV